MIDRKGLAQCQLRGTYIDVIIIPCSVYVGLLSIKLGQVPVGLACKTGNAVSGVWTRVFSSCCVCAWQTVS